MNKYLKEMVKLSKFDAELESFEPQIQLIKKDLNKIITEKEKLKQSLILLNSEIDEHKSKVRQSERSLAEHREKSAQNEEKMSQITNERELESLKQENDINEENIAYANQQIKQFQDVLEIKQEKADSEKARITELDELEIQAQEKVNAELKVLEDNRKDIYSNKADLVATMERQTVTLYERIKRWAKDTTVMPVVNKACTGCNILLNEQTYAELVSGEEIINCPNCGRLIYREEDFKAIEEAEAQEEA